MLLSMIVVFPVSAAGTSLVPDANLAAAIRTELNKGANDDISAADLARVEGLNIYNQKISNYTGLEKCTNLKDLVLIGTGLTSLNSLPSMQNLTFLDVSYNSQLKSVSGIASKFPNLTALAVSSCGISDISPVASLKGLTKLSAYENQLTDVSSLKGLTALYELNLADNQIADISALASLTKLESLDVSSNKLRSISAIANMSLKFIRVERNYLDVTAGSETMNLLAPYMTSSMLENQDLVYLPQNAAPVDPTTEPSTEPTVPSTEPTTEPTTPSEPADGEYVFPDKNTGMIDNYERDLLTEFPEEDGRPLWAAARPANTGLTNGIFEYSYTGGRYQLGEGANAYCYGYYGTGASINPNDFRYLVIRMKGANGGEGSSFGLSSAYNPDCEVAHPEYKLFSDMIGPDGKKIKAVTTDWQYFIIDLKNSANGLTFDHPSVSLSFTFDRGIAGTIYFDEIFLCNEYTVVEPSTEPTEPPTKPTEPTEPPTKPTEPATDPSEESGLISIAGTPNPVIERNEVTYTIVSEKAYQQVRIMSEIDGQNVLLGFNNKPVQQNGKYVYTISTSRFSKAGEYTVTATARLTSTSGYLASTAISCKTNVIANPDGPVLLSIKASAEPVGMSKDVVYTVVAPQPYQQVRIMNGSQLLGYSNQYTQEGDTYVYKISTRKFTEPGTYEVVAQARLTSSSAYLASTKISCITTVTDNVLTNIQGPSTVASKTDAVYTITSPKKYQQVRITTMINGTRQLLTYSNQPIEQPDGTYKYVMSTRRLADAGTYTITASARLTDQDPYLATTEISMETTVRLLVLDSITGPSQIKAGQPATYQITSKTAFQQVRIMAMVNGKNTLLGYTPDYVDNGNGTYTYTITVTKKLPAGTYEMTATAREKSTSSYLSGTAVTCKTVVS